MKFADVRWVVVAPILVAAVVAIVGFGIRAADAFGNGPSSAPGFVLVFLGAFMLVGVLWWFAARRSRVDTAALVAAVAKRRPNERVLAFLSTPGLRKECSAVDAASLAKWGDGRAMYVLSWNDSNLTLWDQVAGANEVLHIPRHAVSTVESRPSAAGIRTFQSLVIGVLSAGQPVPAQIELPIGRVGEHSFETFGEGALRELQAEFRRKASAAEV
ncbi:hypothetical protein KXS11_10520 [Plantibacter flavus]|uniref:hypothetical protein n=1 Tax=Plantibacter flavus TaxID=150123 RepID=UPI003F138F43